MRHSPGDSPKGNNIPGATECEARCRKGEYPSNAGNRNTDRPSFNLDTKSDNNLPVL